MNVIEVDRVSKRFAGHVAVDSLSLAVPQGGIFGLLGPNGAGKSTTIRMILDILVPDEGTISLFGDAKGARHQSRRIGFLPEERGLYPRMIVLDSLIFLGQMRGLSRPDARHRALWWLNKVGLSDWAKHKVQDLSKGMQQKVQLVGALLHEPDLLVLDEPFSGLDPVNAQVLQETVLEIGRSGKTIVFSTHQMEQAESMCDRVVIINRGQKVVDGTLAELKAAAGDRHVVLTFTKNRQAADPILRDRSLVSTVDDAGLGVELELAPGTAPDHLLELLVKAGCGLNRFELQAPSLRAIFISKVGPEAATAPARAEVAHA
ncbi:MAG TPA: ATP-binding cassette domain-containing protein [Gemmatimonadales bacterium]|nr:ATP-binding cassette domain-containing protein [Gemmatimonadales bacterium]